MSRFLFILLALMAISALIGAICTSLPVIFSDKPADELLNTD